MGLQGIFSGTVSILEKVLDLRSKKHNVIISNIANIDTPNYKAFDLIVEEEIAKTAGAGNKLQLKRTQPNHILTVPFVPDNSSYKLAEKSEFTQKGDGNTVDIDKEMANLAENSLMYRASAHIISRKFQGLKNAIEGGKK